MRVLHVITGLDTGGAETMLLRLATVLRQAGVENYVLSLREGGRLSAQFRAAGVPVTSLGMRAIIPLPTHAARLKHVVRHIRPDVVQGWLPHGNLVAVAAARFLQPRAPLVWSIRQALYDTRFDPLHTKLAIRIGARLSAMADAVIYNSEVAAEQHARAGYATKHSLVLPNGFDVTQFRPDEETRRSVRAQLGISDSLPLIGMVARYHPMKDHATFAAAASRMVRAGSDAHFVLAGAGADCTNQVLEALLREHGILDRVHVLGERADASRVYAALDIAVLTSYTEGFPNVLGEAMACAVPCVSTDVGAARLIVGDTGRIAPVRDAEAIAGHCMELLALGRAARHALGAAARRRIEQNWTIEKVAESYAAIYERVRR